MRNFSITTDIDAPTARVWEVMSDVVRWHEWTPSITSIKRMDNGPFVVGSRAIVRQPKFPPALWKVMAIEPGRSFTWANTAPGIRVVGIHSVEPHGAGTRATLALEFHGVLGGLLARLTKGITERYIAMEARGLKARSENPTFRHGSQPI
jgi:hypothetical protein